MPTQKTRRRIKDELVALAGFPPEGIREPFKPTELTWTQRFPMGTGGENRSMPADALAPDEARTLTNLRPLASGLFPVWGYSEVGTPKGSPLEIVCITLYKELDGTSRLIRFDEDELHHWAGSSWTQIAGNGDAMTGDETNTIRAAMVLNTLIWVNGKDAPKVWSVGDATYADLTADSNAPATAQHVAAFADRVVFADVDSGASRNPQRVEWSASGDATDFTSTGAGGATLVDTSDDAASDDIMALKVFDEFLVILRQRSIWVGQRTGEADAPIRFFSVVQGTGCIASDSAQVVGDAGVAFLGADNVYLFHPQNRSLVPIGEPIKARLFQDGGSILIGGDSLLLDQIQNVKSAYVADTRCYHLFYPETGDTWATNSVVFNVGRYQNEERFVWYNRTYSDNITAAFGGQTDGFGTSFTPSEVKLLLGSDVGELFETKLSATTDDGTAVSWVFESPDFVYGNRFLEIKRVNVAYVSTSNSSSNVISVRVDGTLNGTPTGGTLTDTVVNDVVVESGFWAPLACYGRTFSIRMSNTVANSSQLKLVGYRLGFIVRGDINTAF